MSTVPFEFYNSHHAGEAYYEQVARGAHTDAQNLAAFWNQLALREHVERHLPAMESARMELLLRIGDIDAELLQLDKKINRHPRDDNLRAERQALTARLTREQSALVQVDSAIRHLKSIPEPVAPQWLLEWLRAALV